MAIDLKQHDFTVKMTLDVQKCKGPGLWKSVNPEVFCKDGLTNDSDPYGFGEVAAQQNQVMTIHTDRATDIFLDGMVAHLKDLKVGDKIGVDLPAGFKADDVWTHYIRIYRF